jgi:hypothetical protein
VIFDEKIPDNFGGKKEKICIFAPYWVYSAQDGSSIIK